MRAVSYTQINKHKVTYYKDMEILAQIEEKLTLDELENLSINELKQLLNNEILPKLRTIEHPVAAENIFGMAIGFPHIFVRYKLLDIVKEWLPYQTAVETIIRMTHDPDDLVSFKAIEICGNEKIEQSLNVLSPIIGGASQKVTSPRKPVGIGAQKVLKAMIDILDTDNPEELQIKEDYFYESGKLPDNTDFEEDLPIQLIEEFENQKEEGMVLISKGFFTFGLDPEQVPDKIFGWEDATPARKVWLPPFFIDKYPVTNAEYDEFVKDIKKNGHIFCHPNEPRGKDHTRNTYWDERFEPEHPVTGIDFYDAFAYCRWAGKELPTEFQWEKAARGTDGRIWPWGNEFNKEAANWSYTVLGYEPSNLKEWREGLISISEEVPNILVRAAKEYDKKDFVSPYGVVGMIGNHWEWTRSDLSTGRLFQPMLVNQNEKKHHTFAVLKGGSFASLPGLMFPSFRGKDIPFCRHNEMGFRCVKNIPIYKIRKAIGKPITNTALY